MLRIALLGDLAVELDGAPLSPPPGRRARTLLGWLALHPGLHPRARLAARFWPDVMDASARASLRVALTEVRSALGPGATWLQAGREHAGLRADVEVDVLVLRRRLEAGEVEAALEAAEAGELLADLAGDWVEEARTAHRERVVWALEALADRREAEGDLAGAIRLGRRACALDGLAEAPARSLMRRLAAAGERGAALAAFERLRSDLADGVQAVPSPATRALAAELRHADGAAGELPELRELALSHWEEAVGRAAPGSRDRLVALVALGEARMEAGRAPDARSALTDAAELARRLRDGPLLARAALAAAGLGVTVLDDDAPLAALFEEALAALPAGDPARPELLARLAIARAYAPDRAATARIAAAAVEEARRGGDARALARALGALHVGHWHPDGLAARRRAATEMLAAAEAGGDRESALQARHWLALDTLEAGDVAAFDVAVEAYAAACRALPLPAFSWYVPLWRATRATMAGDAELARRLAGEARERGAAAGDRNAELFWRIQIGTLALLGGRAGDLDTSWFEDHARRSPAGAAWWPVVAWLFASRGRLGEARAIVDRLRPDGFAAVPQDTNRLSALHELAEACALTGDAGAAADVHAVLVPYAGRVVVAARGAQASAPVEHALALAAATAGHAAAAVRHRDAALRHAERAGAGLWARRAREALPQAPRETEGTVT